MNFGNHCAIIAGVTVLFMLKPLSLFCQSGEPNQQLHQVFEKLADHTKEKHAQLFPDVSEDANRKEAHFLEDILERLDSIDVSQLSGPDRINFEVFKYEQQNAYDFVKHKMYLIPFNAEGGFYNHLSYSIRDRYASIKEYQKYNDRLKAYPAFFRANIELMREGIRSGIVAPKIIASNYKVLIEPFSQSAISDNLFFKPYHNPPLDLQADSFNLLRDEIDVLIRDSLLPIYQSFDFFMLQEYLPACRDGIGIAEIPGGRALYEQRIRYFSSLDLTPDQVFSRGQSEVKRIRSEMEDIIKKVNFEGTFTEFLDFLRTDPQFYAASPRELLMHASYIAKRIDGLLPRYFDRLPTLPYGVQPVPEAIAPNYTGGRYSGGSWEHNQAGNYWVNTYKLESRPLYLLPSLTLHEAVPGHHLQISLSQEMKGMPGFRNEVYISAFGEGWALYTEWLGNEMGIYETPYEQFGRLTYEMWRACRLVVDVGMHYKGWSRDQAFEFLSSNTALSLHECHTEINRYIGWPGQAVSYKIGELTIRDLRKKCETELGEKFNLRQFHDKILENGCIPLHVLTYVIDDFIRESKHEACIKP